MAISTHSTHHQEVRHRRPSDDAKQNQKLTSRPNIGTDKTDKKSGAIAAKGDVKRLIESKATTAPEAKKLEMKQIAQPKFKMYHTCIQVDSTMGTSFADALGTVDQLKIIKKRQQKPIQKPSGVTKLGAKEQSEANQSESKQNAPKEPKCSIKSKEPKSSKERSIESKTKGENKQCPSSENSKANRDHRPGVKRSGVGDKTHENTKKHDSSSETKHDSSKDRKRDRSKDRDSNSKERKHDRDSSSKYRKLTDSKKSDKKKRKSDKIENPEKGEKTEMSVGSKRTEDRTSSSSKSHESKKRAHQSDEQVKAAKKQKCDSKSSSTHRSGEKSSKSAKKCKEKSDKKHQGSIDMQEVAVSSAGGYEGNIEDRVNAAASKVKDDKLQLKSEVEIIKDTEVESEMTAGVGSKEERVIQSKELPVVESINAVVEPKTKANLPRRSGKLQQYFNDTIERQSSNLEESFESYRVSSTVEDPLNRSLKLTIKLDRSMKSVYSPRAESIDSGNGGSVGESPHSLSNIIDVSAFSRTNDDIQIDYLDDIANDSAIATEMAIVNSLLNGSSSLANVSIADEIELPRLAEPMLPYGTNGMVLDMVLNQQQPIECNLMDKTTDNPNFLLDDDLNISMSSDESDMSAPQETRSWNQTSDSQSLEWSRNIDSGLYDSEYAQNSTDSHLFDIMDEPYQSLPSQEWALSSEQIGNTEYWHKEESQSTIRYNYGLMDEKQTLALCEDTRRKTIASLQSTVKTTAKATLKKKAPLMSKALKQLKVKCKRFG